MSYTPLLQKNPSTKPTYSQMGNGLIENDPIYTPAPNMIEADGYNEIGGTAEACAIMIPLARIRMTHTAGTYSKVSGKAINKNFDLGTLNILNGAGSGSCSITKNGTGDLTFAFSAGIIPAIEDAWVSFHHTSNLFRTANIELTSATTVRVRIGDPTTTGAADALFTLYVI